MTNLDCRLLRGLACFAASAFLALPLDAQVTTHTLTIGGQSAFGCQGAVNTPTLSDGTTLASAQLAFSYDAGTGLLDVVVNNTSQVESGVPNPVLDGFVFNVPELAVTSVSLVSQTAAAGAPPNFTATVDTDLRRSPNNAAFGCFGNFNLILDSAGAGGIANETASTWSVPRSTLSIGAATFQFQLGGPGIAFLTARTIALQFSRFSSLYVNAAANFRDGGPTNAQGRISSVQDACFPTMWLSDQAQLGTTTNLLFSATTECNTVVLVSWNKGPFQVGPATVPIGPPLFFAVAYLGFANQPAIVPLQIPNDRDLLEGPIFWAHGAIDVGFEFSEAFQMDFVPGI
jgi:hypothetical protein